MLKLETVSCVTNMQNNGGSYNFILQLCMTNKKFSMTHLGGLLIAHTTYLLASMMLGYMALVQPS